MNASPILEGVLPIWKEAGPTSFDIVARVRRMLGIRRIGHTGTLDPGVVGVLPLCIGRATRAVEWLQDMPKSYEAVMRIGIATNTEDLSGETIARSDQVVVTKQQIAQAAKTLVGELEQVPPMYSAVKISGKRLYELARAGKTVERKARKVHIYELDILEMNLHMPFPEVRFHVRCSKGTYIRTLCVDFGKTLGYPAAMASLVRTESAGIRREQCVSLATVAEQAEAGRASQLLIPVDRALHPFPELTVDVEDAVKAMNGISLSFDRIRDISGALDSMSLSDGSLCRLYSDAGLFLGVFQADMRLRRLSPVKVWGNAST